MSSGLIMNENSSPTIPCFQTEFSVQRGQQKKKYAKITDEIKELFISKIIYENKSIRRASREIRINYSSAKAILSNHKAEKMKHSAFRKRKFKGFQKAIYRTMVEDDDCVGGVNQIVCSLGGKLVNERDKFKTKLIHKKDYVVSQTESIPSI